MIAYAYERGDIGFGERCPVGALGFAKAASGTPGADKLKRTVTGLAMQAKDGKTLLVPGIPETSPGSKEAVNALIKFRRRVVEEMN